jgi:hypothetical protein
MSVEPQSWKWREMNSGALRRTVPNPYDMTAHWPSPLLGPRLHALLAFAGAPSADQPPKLRIRTRVGQPENVGALPAGMVAPLLHGWQYTAASSFQTGFPEGSSGRGARHRRAAGPHDRASGFALKPIGLTDFRLGGDPDQNRFAVVAGMDLVCVPDALGLCLAVSAR